MNYSLIQSHPDIMTGGAVLRLIRRVPSPENDDIARRIPGAVAGSSVYYVLYIVIVGEFPV